MLVVQGRSGKYASAICIIADAQICKAHLVFSQGEREMKKGGGVAKPHKKKVIVQQEFVQQS